MQEVDRYRRQWQGSLFRILSLVLQASKTLVLWGMQILLLRSVEVHLILRHRIFHIALIPDIEMCFANVCTSPSEGVIKW